MGKWLLAAAIVLPLAARADPATLPAFLPAARQPAVFVARPPADLTSDYSGWGLRATIQGRSMDLAAPGLGWTSDPGAGPKDIVAGYGWRQGGADAVLGYGQFDHGAFDNPATQRSYSFRPREDDPGVLGFSLILHSR